MEMIVFADNKDKLSNISQASTSDEPVAPFPDELCNEIYRYVQILLLSHDCNF